MSTGQISDRRSLGAGVGAAAYFLLTGVIFATWASRVPAIKGGLALGDGQFAITLLGLEPGAVLGLQLGGLVVPLTGSRRALIASLAGFACALMGLAFAPGLLTLTASLFVFAALNSVVDVATNTQGLALGAVALGDFLGAVTLGRLVGDKLVSGFGGVRVFRAGAILAGLGFGSALLVDAPAAGLVGFGLLGAGIANALQLAIGAGGNAPGETPATTAARVSTLGYLGSFAGPALVGGLASLPLALGLPALLVLATALGARAVRQAG